MHHRVDQTKCGNLGGERKKTTRKEGARGVADLPVQLRTNLMVIKDQSSSSAMTVKTVRRTRIVSMGTCKYDVMSDDKMMGEGNCSMKFKRKKENVKAIHATLKELQGIDPLDYLAR